MDVTLQDLKDTLLHTSELYNSAICDLRFDYNNWKENVKLLSPIIVQLREQAQRRIVLCEKEIELNNEKQVATFEKRSSLYSKLNAEKSKLSQLDQVRIKIITQITSLQKEIEDDQNKISELQNKIANAKKENEYWNTVFWATCWIPFANIGTGVKKHVEDGHYYAAAKVLGEDIDYKQRRIFMLNTDLQLAVEDQKQNNKSSGQLANQITAIEGKLVAITTLINTLRNEMRLWQTILTACSEIDINLQYSNGKIEVVMENFEMLLSITQLLILPTTDKYINDCICKGNTLSIGQKLNRNEYLLSENRRFAAIMQSDNNFVVYNSEKQLWESGTKRTQGNGYIELSEHGIVSLKGVNSEWNTKRNGAVVLIMQNDGNLMTYDKNNNPLWGTDTYTYANEPSIIFNKH